MKVCARPVSQLIRVNILIDCLLFKLILEFRRISKGLWNFHIESFETFGVVFFFFYLDSEVMTSEILRRQLYVCFLCLSHLL